jgi:hypothetical protein
MKDCGRDLRALLEHYDELRAEAEAHAELLRRIVALLGFAPGAIPARYMRAIGSGLGDVGDVILAVLSDAKLNAYRLAKTVEGDEQ